MEAATASRVSSERTGTCPPLSSRNTMAPAQDSRAVRAMLKTAWCSAWRLGNRTVPSVPIRATGTAPAGPKRSMAAKEIANSGDSVPRASAPPSPSPRW